MNFLMQDNYPLFDFQNQLLHAQQFWKWKSPNAIFDIKTFNQNEKIENPRRWCPVGSVEFCEEWITKYCNLPYCKPINLPKCLIKDYYGEKRLIKSSADFNNKIENLSNFINSNEHFKYYIDEVYIKSNIKIKDQVNGFYDLNKLETKKLIVENDVQVIPKVIDVRSEWRCFIFNNKLLDIKCYLGDPFTMPSEFTINQMIRDVCESKDDNMPCAFTLDVMCEGALPYIKPLEAHDFFACGLYGFDDNYNLPLMMWEWWLQYVMRNSEWE